MPPLFPWPACCLLGPLGISNYSMSVPNDKRIVFIPLAIFISLGIAITQISLLSSSTFPTRPGIRYDHSSSVVAHQNYTGDSIITYDQSSSSTMTMAVSSQDNTENDYRAFLFATHPTYGMLLLHCTRKEEKPPHFQAPGGHVDKEDFEDAIARSPGESHESSDILILAGKIGAARELYEETGIDIRSALDRLHPVRLWNKVKKKSLFCEFKQRLFFKLSLEGNDFLTAGNKSMNTAPPPLMVKLSDEHQGFIFEPNALKSVDLLVEHSGGKVSKALEKAIKQGEIKSTEDKGDDT